VAEYGKRLMYLSRGLKKATDDPDWLAKAALANVGVMRLNPAIWSKAIAYRCFNCGHEWSQRRRGEPKRTPQCFQCGAKAD
jgi:DNA-directed RNA polymerase subunit RPC12/RpoP